ncbi:MAG: Peptidase inactive domain protein, partial [Verrucomicrobiales bacterium]|nr:Peptidase inactive domain protein [Verrucomicrobiales bacterium]
LVIIVREDHSAPVVAVQAWCQTGSIHEDKWLGAGLSHVLEHMLFKGTTTRPGSRIDQEVQEAGGYMNAYTSFDRTVYHVNVPNTGAKVAIDILCDIMQHATLPADELAKELDVIRREMDMNQDDPGRRAGRRLFECAFTRSPYRLTIIGYPEIFNELKPEDIVGYYRQRYIPNNMLFVVTGDIKTDDAIAQITHSFKGNKARPMAPLPLPPEPKQTGAREIIEEAAIELGHVHVSWHTADLRHPDMSVLDILAALLGSGRSARLYREVREKKGLVTSIDAWTYNPGEIGLFGASAVVDAKQFAPARDALYAEIERIKNEPVPAEELAKVVKQFVASTLATRKTMHGQAQELGANWIGTNDLNFSERYMAAIKSVSAADLQRVARKYFTPENRTLYALLPKGATPQVKQDSEVFKEHAIEKITLTNGLRLLVKEDHRLPFVEIRASFQGGVLAETEANNGVCQLMSKMLLQGTTRRSAEQIATEIESVGGSIDSFGGNNSFGVSVEVLSDDFDTGMDVFTDVMLRPSFPSAPFEVERRVQLESIREQRDHLLHSCARAMRRALFGTTTYGLDSIGNETSVAKLSTNDLQEFHAGFVVPNNCVLAIFGDITTARVKEAVTKAFGDWKKNDALSAEIPKSAPLKEFRRVNETRDKKQAVLVMGFSGASVRDPDRYALELVQEACSDLGSRLFLRIREELGLAYYCGAQNLLGVAPGYFAFYVGTAPDQVKLVEEELLKEAALLREKGLSAEELSRAKAKLIGQKKIARQDLGGLAQTVALDELYGLGYENNDTEDAKYQSVSIEDTKHVAQKYLRADALVVSVVAPEKA